MMDVNNSFHIAIKALIINNEKMLLLRKPPKGEGAQSYWELPGGGLGFGEMPELALKREVMEEVGLSIEVIKPIWVWSFLKNQHRQVLGITYLCHCSSQDVQLSHEHLEYIWVSETELGQLNLLPELREDLEKNQLTGWCS